MFCTARYRSGTGKSVLWTLFLSLLVSAQSAPGQIALDERGLTAGIHTSFAAYGVSVIDYDRDGWDDILLVGKYGVALFRNDGDATFTDVTAQAGLDVTGYYVIGLWADWDNDGDADVFLGNRESGGFNRLFEQRNGAFVDITASAGIDSLILIGSAAAGDFDNDGLVDLFLSTRGGFDKLYRTATDPSRIRFEDLSESSGMKGLFSSIGMQPTWVDFDQDGDMDLFVVHDGFDDSKFYRNRGALPFPDLASFLQIANVGAGNSMGVSWGDIDNDGWQDVYVSRIDSGGLYRNTGGAPFQDVAAAVGADSNGMTWGVLFADLDNDGWEDLPMVNVSGFGGKHPTSLLYRNLQDGTFIDVGAGAGFRLFQDFYGLASGDFDNDGRVDLVAASFYPGGQNRLWMNRSATGNHWVRLRLSGGGGVNEMAIGARVRVIAGGKSYVRTLFAGSSYCSQISPVLHLGLGDAPSIDTLEIFWKGTHREIHTGLAVDSLYEFRRLSTTSVSEDGRPGTPSGFEVLGVYPNPFNGTTRVRYEIGDGRRETSDGRAQSADRRPVRLSIYDVLGREVAVLVDNVLPAGSYTAEWDAGNTSSGVYIVVFRTPSTTTTRTLLHLR